VTPGLSSSELLASSVQVSALHDTVKIAVGGEFD
jgi:hypothetical protein